MGTLFFAGNDRDVDVLETSRLEKLVELHFAGAEPMIGMKLARPLGMDGVMQRLAENGEIDGSFFNWWILDIAQPLPLFISITNSRAVPVLSFSLPALVPPPPRARP